MNMNEILAELKDILAEEMPEFEVDSLSEEARLTADLGLNSMSLLMLMLAIEDRFGFEFEDDADFRTVGDVCAYIEERCG